MVFWEAPQGEMSMSSYIFIQNAYISLTKCLLTKYLQNTYKILTKYLQFIWEAPQGGVSMSRYIFIQNAYISLTNKNGTQKIPTMTALKKKGLNCK